PGRPTGSCTRPRPTGAPPAAPRGKAGGGLRRTPGDPGSPIPIPNRFQPDPEVLAEFGVRPDEPYSIVRFVSWQAVHDRQERGLSVKQKRHLIELLQRRGRGLISAEAPLTPHLAAP